VPGTLSRTYRPSKPVEMEGAALRLLKMEIEQCPGSPIVE
jgi:hypothetical protein